MPVPSIPPPNSVSDSMATVLWAVAEQMKQREIAARRAVRWRGMVREEVISWLDEFLNRLNIVIDEELWAAREIWHGGRRGIDAHIVIESGKYPLPV